MGELDYKLNLTEDTAPTEDDIIVVVDDVSGTPVNRKVTLANLFKSISLGGSSLWEMFITENLLPEAGTEDGEHLGNFRALRLLQTDPWHIYGGFQSQSETVTCAVQNTWYPITNVTNDLWTVTEYNGFTVSDDVVTVINGGDYVGAVSVTISGIALKKFEVRVYNITQATSTFYQGITTTGASNFINLSMPVYIETMPGDQFRFEVRCTSVASGDPTFEHGVFNLKYLHD